MWNSTTYLYTSLLNFDIPIQNYYYKITWPSYFVHYHLIASCEVELEENFMRKDFIQYISV